MLAQSMATWQPSCAICGFRSSLDFADECPHEAEALTRALQQALERSQVMRDIKDWVIDKAKRQIGRDFKELRAARYQHHTEYVQRLPCYSLYQRYHHNPHYQFPQLQTVKSQIAHANQVYTQGVDDDWRKSCLQYPSVLEGYFNLVEIGFPDDDEASLRDAGRGRVSPAPAPAVNASRRGHHRARRGSGDYSAGNHNGHRRKERKRSRARTRTPPRAPSVGRHR